MLGLAETGAASYEYKIADKAGIPSDTTSQNGFNYWSWDAVPRHQKCETFALDVFSLQHFKLAHRKGARWTRSRDLIGGSLDASHHQRDKEEFEANVSRLKMIYWLQSLTMPAAKRHKYCVRKRIKNESRCKTDPIKQFRHSLIKGQGKKTENKDKVDYFLEWY